MSRTKAQFNEKELGILNLSSSMIDKLDNMSRRITIIQDWLKEIGTEKLIYEYTSDFDKDVDYLVTQLQALNEAINKYKNENFIKS